MKGPAAQAISYRGVSKDYGATRALVDVDLDLPGGQVHALVGENGAGKSTCLSILAGRIAPTRGEVRVSERVLRCGDPRASRREGVIAIYQELTIVPALTAQANVFLGGPLARTGILNERAMRARYEDLCHEMGVVAAPDGVPAGSLSVAEQQLLEIMRALVADARVILFDEPTAALALHERDALLALIDRLRAAGVTVAFVSHNLDEVLKIADTVTVFRDGRIVARGPRSEWNKTRLVEEMLGTEAGQRLAHELLEDSDGIEPRRNRPSATPLLAVEDLTIPGVIEGIDLELHAGEIVGLGGLVGSGRTSILRALSGLEPEASGTLWVDGKKGGVPRSVRHAMRLGIALLPEDRKIQGLVPQLDAATNMVLPNLGAVSKLGVISRRRLTRAIEAVAPQVGFSSARAEESARNLSGGNQQKLLMARWCFRRPRILLADEPTRGIDIGAKAEIVDSLEAMAADGLGVIVVSSELEEVCAISHRIVVLTEGRVTGVLDRSQGPITPTQIMSTAFGLERDAHVAA
jgi:ABC-type sugar transport system ATPase subunit